jgi:hypothetical protein
VNSLMFTDVSMAKFEGCVDLSLMFLFVCLQSIICLSHYI